MLNRVPSSIVQLPRQVQGAFQVYVNGVPQHEGVDVVLRGRELRFQRELVKEGRVATWRWLIGAFGVGTYRRNDSVDVGYEVDGRPMLAEALDIQSLP
jgi:hypothetical protein